MKPCCVIILISAFFIISCRLNNESDNKSVFNDLVKKYPELYGNGLIDDYKLVRKVYNIKDSIEMQLFEDQYPGNQILILSNTKGKSYAVPLPDNDYRAYWGFYGDSVRKASTNKMFDGEMNKALKVVPVKEYWPAKGVLIELMISVLQMRPIFPADSSSKMISGLQLVSDSCDMIATNNTKAIFKGLTNATSEFTNTFRDFHNGRFFQFQSSDVASNKKYNIKFIIYRDPCIIKPIIL